MAQQVQVQLRKAVAAKQKEVEVLVKLASSAKIIAAADLRNLPDRHLQSLRKKLRGQGTIMVTRNTLLVRALEKAKRGTELLLHVKGPVAVIFTELDPFKLQRIMRQSRGKAFAKPGQPAPFDIVVPAGETALPPGPVLTELKQAGIDARIAGGKVTIGKDSVVAKTGEKISDGAAKALQKLGIQPFEVGVNLVGAWDQGIVYPLSVLDVDEDKVRADFVKGYQSATALSFSTGFPTKAAMPMLIAKAVAQSRALAINIGMPEKEVIAFILAKAQAQAKALESMMKK